MSKLCFPKIAKVLHRTDYKRLNRFGQRKVGRFLLVDAVRNDTGVTRLGLTVTKRFGRANVRVRFKRIVREAFRLSRAEFPQGYDLNIRPRSLATQASMQDIHAEMCQVLSDLRDFASGKSNASRSNRRERCGARSLQNV